MFEKRKEKKLVRAREFDDNLLGIEKKFDAAIEKAGQMTDPAAKILALNEMGNNIVAQIVREKSEISKKAEGAKRVPKDLGAGLWVGGVATLFLVAGPPGWIAGGAAVAGSLGADAVAHRRRKTTRQNLEKASDDHLNRLRDRATRSFDMAVEVAGDEKNVEAISRSPALDKILKLPGIADKFSDVAAKKIADAKTAAEADVAEGNKLLRPARKPTDFKKPF